MASVIFLAFKHLRPSRIQLLYNFGGQNDAPRSSPHLSLGSLNHWIHLCRVEEIDAGQESLVEEATRLRKRVLLAESHRPWDSLRRMNLYLRMSGRAKESDSESVRLGARLKRGTAIASPETLLEFVN
ncbi:Hypothetical predicted protein [Prunus dulcis]|uniref:Uncharacterized protein n=1 Tax=Prunus dulcis TaxID=3755 RepID=A0A5E4E6F3_PRUDU|nr:hypothetical protein L3X38_038946 [Prunus dulcis]VVA09418.1 Hypothetical predicted protein [Prunus dulcis]